MGVLRHTLCRTGVRVAVLLAAAWAVLLEPHAALAAAGRTPGSFTVTPWGAATYSIPIWAPPGPRGVGPHLALTYNSNGTQGSFGVGWSLSGLSAITRCTKTYAQDNGAPAPVTLTYSDRFCLNGNRLRLTPVGTSLQTYGNNGASTTTYQTELADFSNVTASGTTGNGPSSFKVQTRDGYTFQYGSRASITNSQFELTSNSVTSVQSWLLSEIDDPWGNAVMVVTYQAGTVNPTAINWAPTAAGASTYNYSMNFAYSTTATPVKSKYVANAQVNNTSLISTIDIWGGSSTVGGTGTSLVKEYSLTTQQSPTTGQYRLTSVQDCAGSGQTDCLLPTAISYQDGQAGITTSAASAPGAELHYDFNGDGRPDAVYYSGGVWYVALNTGSGFGSPINTGVTDSGALFGDLLGAGADGILGISGSSYSYYTYNSSSSGFSSASTGFTPQSGYTYVLADFTGDGLLDLVGIATNTTTIVTVPNQTQNGGSISFGTPYSFNALSSPPTGTIKAAILYANGNAAASNFRSVDFNGDGRKDVLLYIASQTGSGQNLDYTYHYYELISQGANAAFTTVHIPLDPTANPYFVFGNFNDDNCTDVALYATVYYSGCNGVVASTYTLPTGGVVAAMDWDGDGRTDLLIAGSGNAISWYQSTGTVFASLASTGFTLPTACVQPTVFDVDADSLDDLGCTTSYYVHKGAAQPPDLATSITDGFGVNVSFNYVPITTPNNSPYSLTASAKYPEVNVTKPLYVVKTLTASDGIGGTYTQSFQYQNARADLTGRGFEGFQIFNVSDSRANSVKSTFFTAFPWTRTLQEQDFFQSDGTLISQTVSTPASLTAAALDATAANQRYFPYLTDRTTKSYEVQVSASGVRGSKNGQLVTTTDTNFIADGTVPDAYGNFPRVLTTVTDNDSVSPSSPYLGQQWTTKVITTVSPYISGSEWCLNLPTQVQVLKTTSQSSITRTVAYTPDPVHCVQSNQTIEPTSYSGAYALTDSFLFDNFGNVSSDARSGANVAQCPGSAPCTTTYDWGPSGQFLMSITNALSQKTSYNYDFTKGVLTSQTDPNNISIGWQYDEFARKYKETRPDGTYTQLTYSDCAANGCVLGSHGLAVTQTVYGSNASAITDGTSYLDAFDRPLMSTKRMLAAGAYSRNEVRYDQLGNVIQRYAPCQSSGISTACAFPTNIIVDALGRPTRAQRQASQTDTTSVTTTLSYQGRTTVVTDANGNASTKVVTVSGVLGQSKDATGYYLTYNTDAWGSVISVVDSIGNKLSGDNTYTYGAGAFRTASADIDMGGWSYTIDAFGEPINWTDAAGNPFSMTYDPLSRPTKRTEPDLTTNWTWGSTASSYNIGQLAGVSTANGYSETYTYDSHGRLLDRSIVIPSDGTYNYDYTYSGTTGFLDTLTYPLSTSSYRLKLQYGYQNGLLQQISDFNAPSTVYWTAGSENSRGQLTSETLGSGSAAVTVTRVFDPVTGFLDSIQAGVGGGYGLQNQTYMFDYVGNLTQRQDGNAGLTENFVPDQLNRLSTSTLVSNGTTTTNLQMQYDALGNIHSRSDIAAGAAWTYDSVHVHQVLTAGDANHTYSYDNTNGAAGNGNVTFRNGNQINWTSYNFPSKITFGSESEVFSYGPDRQRYAQTYTSSTGTESTFYAGGLLEKTTLACGVTAWRHYVYAGGHPAAIVSRKSTGYNSVNYVLQDHLGGTAAFVDGSTGKIKVQESFGAFGLERSPADWSSSVSQTDAAAIANISRRGFTFHTGLGQPGTSGAMGLVHMNGRVEDAVIGRFLSADPHTAQPMNAQDYNRYGYVDNNPLAFIDPTGFTTTVSEFKEGDDWGGSLWGFASFGQESGCAAGNCTGDPSNPAYNGGSSGGEKGSASASTGNPNTTAGTAGSSPLAGDDAEQTLQRDSGFADISITADRYHPNEGVFAWSLSSGDLALVSNRDSLWNWVTDPDHPYRATPLFRARFEGSLEEVAVTATMVMIQNGSYPVREVLTGADLQLPGGIRALYDIYTVGPPETPIPGARIANIRGSNTYYYSPYHYDPGPDVPNAYVQFTLYSPK